MLDRKFTFHNMSITNVRHMETFGRIWFWPPDATPQLRPRRNCGAEFVRRNCGTIWQ
jgi:hypothetical protein